METRTSQHLTATQGRTLFVASALNVSTVVRRVMSADDLSCFGCERAIAEVEESPSMNVNWKAIQSSARARSNGQKVQCFAWIMSTEASPAPKALEGIPGAHPFGASKL